MAWPKSFTLEHGSFHYRAKIYTVIACQTQYTEWFNIMFLVTYFFYV